MNKRICISIVAILIIATIVGVVMASSEESVFCLAGQLLRVKKNENAVNPDLSSSPIAQYNGQIITAATVEYYRKLNIIRDDEELENVDAEIKVINAIIQNMILLEEAELLGFTATDEEVEVMLQGTELAYSTPEGKEMLDAYLAGAEITFDDYLNMMREQMPRFISRQKLLDYIGRQYCEEHGIEFTKVNPPAEMIAAQDAYVEELFEKNKDKIEYFIDVPEVS